MHNNAIANTVINSLKKTSNFWVILKKIFQRIRKKQNSISTEKNLDWIKSNISNFEDLAKSLDKKLWGETQQTSQLLTKNANQILAELDVDLGGGGFYPLLYFITRYIKPNVIVESGVAAGFSSYAFLKAIENNNKGSLYSSDFPYFRLANPEKYIGIVVEEDLKKYWHLYTEGDEINLPKILGQVDKIDIFHYDSDKSYSGREMATSLVSKKLDHQSIILMDDIQDNCFFYDYILQYNPPYWYVFEFENKYIGMIGNLFNKFNQ